MLPRFDLYVLKGALLASLALCPSLEGREELKTPVDWVDPLIDTHGSRWFYFNSASRPFGMVNLSPDTATEGSWNSGYLYDDETIRCFSHIHAWQLAGVPVMPVTDEMRGPEGMDAYQSRFSHADEVVKPGYHKVVLQDYDISVELSSTMRVGMHRYVFPEGRSAHVLFDIGAKLAHGETVLAEARKVNDREVEGMSLHAGTPRRTKDTPVYFVARFDQGASQIGAWNSAKEVIEELEEIAGAGVGMFASFEPGVTLLMKVGISYTSIENARLNLDTELEHWDFDRVVADSRSEWNDRLSRIEVEGGSVAQKTKFYTDLWRSQLGRRVVSDVDGHYMDMTGEPQVRQVPLDEQGRPQFPMHNSDAWWGSHWSLDILWPLLCPETYSDFVKTALEMYKNGGMIPRGPSGGNYTFVMIGDSAAPALTAAYQKGIRDYDARQVLAGLVRNTEPDGSRYYGGYAKKPNEKAYREYSEKGYVSWGNGVGGAHGNGVTSLTFYNSYHDWCIAQLAESLGERAMVERFAPGALNYRNLLWPEKGYAWVKLPNGSWKEGFAPTADVFEQPGFCEASAALTTYYVPHDPQGMAEYLGGMDAVSTRLNAAFEEMEPRGFIEGKHKREHASVPISYSNQDGTGHAHFFNRIGYPWLSQKWVRKVHEANYSGTDPHSGYNGDEDQGQMASLSALMALGLFQFDGGSGIDSQYDITAPVFERVRIRLSDRYYDGDVFEIEVENQSPENLYIQSATWNGQPWQRSLLPHKDLVSGGILKLVVGPEPNEKWGH
ncbi:GH92 family glycosyl hydrolase [Pelagicoccus sp. SDUM812002]|uniref:GH92 family glycosyl hydrolase n=1 Tax=Pelagicoccus sp. SDUM812002 TaxID=3041266 RepID=UPI00280D5733|nr:GH92 family glycosyl hydrolase [Pelagicoccus sp. SDUM812002]MDQ8186009.1 GH92 family glycosyl hydrolase [Pelagicoccus sp. SDUM812002]